MSLKYIRIASDLHLEGFSGRNSETLAIDFVPKDDRDAESILILAGDISSDPGQLFGFLKCLLPRFEQVLYVPGNHEYYRHDYVAWNKTMDERLLPLVPDGLMFSLGSVKMSTREAADGSWLNFVYGTLWADGGPTLADKGQVGFYLNDFRLITMPGHNDPSYRAVPRRFTVDDMIAEHKAQKDTFRGFLEFAKQGPNKTIAVSHHLPSRRLVSARFWPKDGSDGANGGFASDCDNMICTLEPALWVHGHTHDTIDTQLWKTRIICNPAGYRGEWATKYNTFMSSENGLKNSVVTPKFIEVGEL